MKTKKFISLFAAAALAVISILPASAEEGDAKEVRPNWFDADQKTTWWATDPYDGVNNEWRYSIDAENGKWTYTMHSNLYDYGTASSNGTAYSIDLDETPYLNFTSEMVAESSKIRLRLENNVEVAAVQPGENSISVDLSANEEILKYADSNNCIYVFGIEYTTDKFYGGESISFENFVFSSERGENAIRKDWFDSSRDTDWWNDNQRFDPSSDNNRIVISHPEGYKWQLKFRWCGTQRADCIADIKMLNLDSFDRLCYDMNNDKATDMYLILIPFAGDTAQWDNRLYMNLGTVAQGESSGSFELSSYEEIRNAANSANSIYITGIAFGLEGFVTDDTMNLKDLYFAPEDVTSSAEFSYQGGGISKVSDGTSVTFTADVAVTGDPSVTYKWYVDGVQTDANGSEFTVPNDTVGNHSVYGVVCVGDDYYTAARYVSETVSYGAYIAADVSMDGEVNAGDLSTMRIKLITGETLSDIEKLSADLNEDGEVDILDLIKIKKLMSENVG